MNWFRYKQPRNPERVTTPFPSSTALGRLSYHAVRKTSLSC